MEVDPEYPGKVVSPEALPFGLLPIEPEEDYDLRIELFVSFVILAVECHGVLGIHPISFACKKWCVLGFEVGKLVNAVFG